MKTIKQIIFNAAFRRFVIVPENDIKSVGVKLDDDEKDDGFVVLNDEEDAITLKAFDGINFIYENGGGIQPYKYSMYLQDGDKVIVEGEEQKVVDTGSAQVYAQGLETDTPEVKAKKLQAILDLTDFKRMCVEIINR